MSDENLVKAVHTSWKAFRSYMSKVDGTLLADSPKFKGTSLVIHSEGMMLQESSSVEVHEVQSEDEAPSNFVLVVFGEHMQATFFELDQVSKWANLTLHRPYEVLPPEPDEEDDDE